MGKRREMKHGNVMKVGLDETAGIAALEATKFLARMRIVVDNVKRICRSVAVQQVILTGNQMAIPSQSLPARTSVQGI